MFYAKIVVLFLTLGMRATVITNAPVASKQQCYSKLQDMSDDIHRLPVETKILQTDCTVEP